MNQIYRHDITIHHELPPESFEWDIVAWDIEMWEQQEGRLHRPHGELALIACTLDGKNVYLVEYPYPIKIFFERIDKAAWVLHNAAYDIKQLRRWVTIPDRKNIWDTMLIDLVRYSGYYDRFALDDLYRRYCGNYLPKEERKSFATKPDGGLTEEQIFYAACDVVATWEIYQKQKEQIDENDLYVWENIERPTLWTLLDTGGITVDKDKWLAIAQDKEDIASSMWNELHVKYGINIRSPKQLLAYLQSEGVDIESTDRAVLQAHVKDHEIIPVILSFRKPAKGASTYGKKWAAENIEEDGRVYTSYRQIGAVTGRMASANPNLQNIPVRDEPIYRECFIAGAE